MIGHIKPEHDKVAHETYGGDPGMALNELRQSASLMGIGGGNLTAALGLSLNFVDPQATQTGPRNDPGFHA